MIQFGFKCISHPRNIGVTQADNGGNKAQSFLKVLISPMAASPAATMALACSGESTSPKAVAIPIIPRQVDSDFKYVISVCIGIYYYPSLSRLSIAC